MNRRWPDFFIIGAMKAGTTTLHDYLEEHKNIFMVDPKEPGYFSQPKVFSKGDDWYLSLYDSAEKNQLLGDGSTCYSRWPTYPDVPNRIFERNPNAKFIYIVRDPVKRAYSHYRHRMEEIAAFGGEHISFETAIETDEEMLMAGNYAVQIKQFLEYYPLDSFYILDFEELINMPENVLKGIFEFLGIKDIDIKNTSHKMSNQSGTVVKRIKISNKLKNIRRSKFIKPFFDIMTPEMREKIFNFASRVSENSVLGKNIAEKYVKEVKPPNSEDLEVLCRYYEKRNIEFNELTGFSIEHWSS